MLVLLIIFMVTAPMLQRGIEVKLPQARNAGTVEGDRVWVTVPLRYKQDQILYLGEEALKANDTARATLALEEAEKRAAEGGAEKLADRLEALFAGLQRTTPLFQS